MSTSSDKDSDFYAAHVRRVDAVLAAAEIWMATHKNKYIAIEPEIAKVEVAEAGDLEVKVVEAVSTEAKVIKAVDTEKKVSEAVDPDAKVATTAVTVPKKRAEAERDDFVVVDLVDPVDTVDGEDEWIVVD